MNEIFFDTETTGLSLRDGHKILEIACIETKDLIPTGNFFHSTIQKEMYLKRPLKYMAFLILF